MHKYKLFKMKEDILEKRDYNLCNFGGNIIYSKIHIIVKIDGKKVGIEQKSWRISANIFQICIILIYRLKNINHLKQQKENSDFHE